ncbi:hypothetical protein [Ulvibacter antarcticus]|uniref:GLPGLI family protein n=1 Tax=Ulvibacter antarcticus TaxID=442714 RepID=A0A3L9Z5X3_9FLAO|nr:hypothetical protein [Ulvibacter antarcticus]RMA65665.1 hypothetical protein BXY75_0077 [Ulvibacter antarcticus]
MKNLTLTLVFAVISLTAWSQANNAAYSLTSRVIEIQQSDVAFGLTQAQFESTAGSPYSNVDFLQGNIYKDKKLAQTGVLMRYNMFSDEIEIKNSSTDKTYGALIQDASVFVKIFNDIYVFAPFQGSNANGHYFKVVTEGTNFDLYKKEEVTYQPPYAPKTTYEREKPAEWVKNETYFLVSKSGDYYELPNSKSKILKVMKNKEKDVKDYIKKNKLDLDKEKDLEKLVDYYNSIL